MSELIMKILELVIAIVILLCTRYLIPYIKELLGTAQWNKLISYVAIAVKAAEKLFPGEKTGKDKKAYVVEFIGKITKKLNVNITEEEINNLIESAVEDLELAKKEA